MIFGQKLYKKKKKVANELLSTRIQEITESVTINGKTNPQPSTETPPSATNNAAPTPAQEKVEQKINIENDILVDLYRKRDLGQLSQSYRNEITSREATLRKSKADLKQKEAARKRQQKFCANQKRKTQAIEEQTGANFQKSCKKKKNT